VFQDENRFSTGRIARLNLKRAEKARLIISKIPGTFRTRSNAIRKEYYLVIPIASLNEVRLKQFVVCKSAAVVDNLISRNTRMGERKKEAVPVRRGMLLFQFLLCRHDSVVVLVATDEFDLFLAVFKAGLVAVLEEHKQARIRQEEERRRLRVNNKHCCNSIV